jgi:D-tagatose-1,6-bisphosphate aldolase subunit GatZ/KbaZ
VVDYDRARTTELSRVLEGRDLVFEAHSTDYQTVERLTALVEDHWAVLKVGPGLTFALREVLFGLAEIEAQLFPAEERSALPDVVDTVMVDEPRWWKGYYEGDEDDQRIARRYSYSDRLRYYWPNPRITAAVDRLMRNLRSRPVPLPLLSAHLPQQYARVREGLLTTDPEALALDHVRDVCRTYALACTPQTQRNLS